MNSLSTADEKQITKLHDNLENKGCIPLDLAQKICSDQLLSKLQAIGMIEYNEVANDSESKVFITRPTAFNKFGNPFEDDALDLAKAFVSSLSYGMTYRNSGEGRISALSALMGKLINGYVVGPATAICQDYRILELKGVIRTIPEKGGKCYMKLLKKDVGILALDVLQKGGAASEMLTIIPSARVTLYRGPESKRQETRKKIENKRSQVEIMESLRILRS